MIGGLIAALIVLPVPGKTFFNKLSRLPNNIKDLIDDSLDILDSLSRLLQTVGGELGHRTIRTAKTAIKKSNELKDKLITEELIEEELEKEAARKNGEDLNG